MQNIEVRFNASSNFGKVEADLAALRAEAAALGKVFEKSAYAQSPAIVDPQRWKVASTAVHRASEAYRNAASSSGLLTTQQIRATSAAEQYTKALQKQKLSFGEMRKHSGIMKQVYQDQLRYQRMSAQYWGTDMSGRAITDITIPKNVPKELDTIAQKAHFAGQMMKSAGTQVVNLGKNMQWAGRQLTVGFTYPMVLFGAAAGLMAYKTEDAFGKINKVYDYSAEALTNQNQLLKEQGDLRVKSMDTARQVAEEYGLTLTKTLAVEQQLAATGLKDQKLLDTTKQVQRFSALGDIDPEQTTQMVIALQNAFKKETGTAQGLTDTLNFMNAASNATSLSLQDIAESTPRAAAAMSQMGVSARDMTVLLVSMREAGVNAVEGANALKSASARILNSTITDRVTKLYKSMGANIDVGAMVDKSKGNFLEFIKLMGAAQRANSQLTAKQQAQAKASLFGTYQFSRLSAALKNIDDAQNGVNNQTSKAIELQNASSQSLQHMADVSQEAMMATPAAKLRKAWATFQFQLAETGKPFLEAASQIVKAGSKILGWFNGLGDKTKKIAMLIAALAAIAGPIVMLGGLFLNLTGQFMSGMGKMLSGASRLAGAVGLVNKEEKASALTAEAQNKAFQSQEKVVSTLAEEIAILTAAYKEATLAAKAFAETTFGPSTPMRMHGPQTQTLKGQGFVAPYQLTSQEQTYYSGTSRTGSNGTQALRLEQARNKMAMDYMRANHQTARDATITEKQIAAQNKVQEKMNRTVTGTSLAGGAMAVSMAAMMVSSNQTVDNIAKWTMVGAMVVPALAMAMKFAGGIAVSLTEAAVAQLLLAERAVMTAGAMGGAAVMARALGTAIMAAMGPIGWISLGITAIGAGLLFWKHKQDEIAKKQKEMFEAQKAQQDALTNGVKQWADSVGKVGRGYGEILRNTLAIKQAQKTSYREGVDYYRKPTSEGGGGDQVAAYQALEPSEQQMTAMQMFIKLQAEAGLTAKEAAIQMSAFFVAGGLDALRANEMAKQLLETIGEFSKFGSYNNKNFMQNELDLFKAADPAELEGRAQGLANAFTAAMSDGATVDQAKAAMQMLADQSAEAFGKAFQDGMNSADWAGYGSKGSDMLKWLGIDSAESAAKYFATHTVDEMKHALEYDGGFTPKAVDELTAALSAAATGQRALMDSISKSPLDLGTITSISDLWDNIAIKAKTLSYQKQVQDAQTLVAEYRSLGVLATEEHKQNVLNTINEYNRVNHLKTANTLTQALHNLMYGVTDETGKAADEAKRLVQNLPTRLSVSISFKQVGGIVKDAMSSVQSQMADSAMNKFNAGWDATMTATQNAQQAAQDEMDRRQQAAQDAFDARWQARKDAVTKAYQARIDQVSREIEAEQRADDIRQRLFDKEKARLQQIADMENANIDFNTALNEGRLDDAAKTLNNANVKSANDQMDAEEAAAKARSEARIKALEKKNDRLEKQRDKEIKQLEKMEARMRKHLERIQDMRSKALQQQQEAFVNSQQQQRDIEEATLNARLDLFKAYTAKNKTDLEAWMKELGFKYDEFGTNIMEKGQTWADSFKQSLKDALLQAGTEALSDNMWEGIGAKMALKLLKGLGFDNLAQFNQFIKTGVKHSTVTPGGHEADVKVNHGGGVIGGASTGRGNIPNTYKGLHRSEQMVLAQKGEYIINRKASSQHRGLLEAVNSGSDIGQGGFGGPAAFMAGAITRAFGRGLQTNMQNKIKNKRGGTDQGYKPGAGGRHRPITGPVTSGVHDQYTGYPALDFAGPVGRPVYAVADGIVSRSYDIGGPLASDHYRGDGPYGSYGRVVYLKTNDGPEALYAHLSRRSVKEGAQVKGGAVLGYSGNTGNSSGPHLHFGATNGPAAWLRKGGTLKYDNTPVIGHKGETMLSAPLTAKFKDAAAGGGGDHFHVTLDLRGAMIKENVDIEKAINDAIDTREAKVGRKRVVR